MQLYRLLRKAMCILELILILDKSPVCTCNQIFKLGSFFYVVSLIVDMNKKGYSNMEVIDFSLSLFIVPKEQSIKLLIMRVWMLTFLAHLVRAFNNG